MDTDSGCNLRPAEGRATGPTYQAASAGGESESPACTLSRERVDSGHAMETPSAASAPSETECEARALLAAGALTVRYCDGWRARLFAREGRTVFKVIYQGGRWTCECFEPACVHVAAARLLVRVV
jgi:hypothetical protein